MAQRSENTLHIIGLGSQAQAWAQCLRASGWSTPIYLSRPEGKSALVAKELGFDPPRPLSALSHLCPAPAPHLIAFLCPDTVIGSVYSDFLASSESALTLVLAHGYAVYAGDLKPARPAHELALFAPKAIGPKIWSLYQDLKKSRVLPEASFHRLVAGFSASESRTEQVQAMARAMGFAPHNWVPATFEQEAIGDMISEQGLLCGGVFTLLEWTLEAMQEAGIPPRLIREECLSELELIAGLLRERGPSTTFRTISQAAQAGTIAMQETLNQSGVRAAFDARLKEVVSRRFADRFRAGEFSQGAQDFANRLARWQKELQP